PCCTQNDGVVGVTGSSQVRVGGSVLPVTQKRLSDPSARTGSAGQAQVPEEQFYMQRLFAARGGRGDPVPLSGVEHDLGLSPANGGLYGYVVEHEVLQLLPVRNGNIDNKI